MRNPAFCKLKEGSRGELDKDITVGEEVKELGHFSIVMVICVDTVPQEIEEFRKRRESCKNAKSFVHEGHSSYLLL